jgi:hypothetical protein
LGKFCRVIFGHAFQNALDEDAAGIVGDVLSCRDHTNTIFLQFRFVDGAVVTISCKAVKLVHKNSIEGVPFTGGNHSLKLGAIIIGPTLCPVYELSDNCDLVGSGIIIAGFQLAFDTLFCLRM